MANSHRTGALTAPLVLAAALAAALPAAAQGPATIRGRVYACETGRPVAHATVHLHGLDERSTITLSAGADGRFARVGLAPGRYLIDAAAPLPTQPVRYGHWVAPVASRLARVETDDVLDLRIGTEAPARFFGVGPGAPAGRARVHRAAAGLRRPAGAPGRADLRPLHHPLSASSSRRCCGATERIPAMTTSRARTAPPRRRRSRSTSWGSTGCSRTTSA